MASAKSSTLTAWSAGFETLRREKLFKNPAGDQSAFPALDAAAQPHLDSFNAVFQPHGLLDEALKDIGTKTYLDDNPSERNDADCNRLSVKISEWFFDKSALPPANKYTTTNRYIYPSECRERHSSYRGRFRVRLGLRINDGEWKEVVKEMGFLPIMLRTSMCHLKSLSQAGLIHRKEEGEEFGGYFIVNGNEKFIRMLILPKRNYPMAIDRPSFATRGPTYTPLGIQMRSVRPDQTSQTCVLHYLNDGNVMFRFSWRKNEYLLSVVMILKALVETNDREIFEGIIGPAGSKGLDERQFVMDCVETMLRTYKANNMHTRAKTRAHLGSRFRSVLNAPEDMTDEEAGGELLRKIVLPHLGANSVTDSQDADKFSMLLFMIRKLYAFVQGECAADNPDAASNQEILLGGFLYGMILKERLDEWLNSIRQGIVEWGRTNNWKLFTSTGFSQALETNILRKLSSNIGGAMDYFLSTGNLTSVSGLDLQQVSGFSVPAEKINFYRFLSHFRSVHRGSFFAQLKTTTVRKLLPESWGFFCPVHTPDGAPCGLMNHLAHKCEITTQSLDTSEIPSLMAHFGVASSVKPLTSESVVVQLDGRILGFCTPKQARVLADTLRHWKVEGSHGTPVELEIGYVPSSNGGQFPGVYMFAHPARMLRPVKYLPLEKQDYVGPFEQPFMSIACKPNEIISGESTHVEFSPTNVLSVLANLTPFPDFNQSPRNMYQCQMAKQTMGTFGNSIRYRADNKAYRLQSGQTPVVRPPLHNEYGLDNYPNGTNAIVAVISYTGYDMDDAMILSKPSHERGFAHGTIYKTKKIALEEAESGGRKSRSQKTVSKLFGFAPGGIVKTEWRNRLDEDGLPLVGQMVTEGSVIAASHTVSWDPSTNQLVNRDGRTELHRYKDTETAYVEEVRLLGSEDGTAPAHTISIKFRIPRSPTIGDKFSSRHGQKGVCSQRWRGEDMPFSESGMVPDVIINPHAFPSRMTIGMFIESLAGKSGCLHGMAQDSTPFQFEDSQGHRAVDYFGEQLRAAGYNYYGNEPMYSGITGEELAADIYIGVVYYQRLRHMVNDKYQVRTTGPVNQNTGQPVKGRSKGGGIRVGEMERDALIAHGTAFLLQDRLMNCSDYTKSWVCRQCGTFLATSPTVGGFERRKRGNVGVVRCRKCAKRADAWTPKTDVWEDGQGIRMTGGDDTTVVAVPGVLKYLDVELAAMGVGMRFDVKP